MLLEVSNETSLYHRSPIKLKVGDKVVISKNEEGKSWMSNKPFELVLEEERKLSHPNKPSRLNCIYSTLVPRSRFIDKGYLYRIKPTGKLHITDSTLIDSAAEKFEREISERMGFEGYSELMKQIKENPKQFLGYLSYDTITYWNGVTPNKANIKDIEILSEGAVVLEEVVETGKSKPLRPGEEYVVAEDNKLVARLDLYINSKYDREGLKNLSDESIKTLLYLIQEGLFINPKIEHRSEDNITIKGYLRKGAKLRLISARHAILFGRYQSEQGKYNVIMSDFYLPNVGWIYRDSKKNKANLSHRFETALYMYKYEGDGKMVYDFTKYLAPV